MFRRAELAGDELGFIDQQNGYPAVLQVLAESVEMSYQFRPPPTASR